MAYYLQGEVHREFIFDCNEYSNQTIPVINNGGNTPSFNPTTGKFQGTGISVYNGVGRFRFSLSDDLYVRKTALKWAQIPMVMNTLPEDVTTYLEVTFHLSNIETESPNGITAFQLPIYFNLNTRQTFSPDDERVGPLIDASNSSTENYSPANDVPRFIAPIALAQKITDILNYIPQNLGNLMLLRYAETAVDYPAPTGEQKIQFAQSGTANGYTLTWPTNYEPEGDGNVEHFFPIQAVSLAFLFFPPNTTLTPANHATPTVATWYNAQNPSPANFRSVNRFASYTLGTTFADLGGFTNAAFTPPQATFVSNTIPAGLGMANQSTNPYQHAFAYCVIDVLQNLYQGTPLAPPGQLDPPVTYQIVSNSQFAGGGPPYLLLHSSLMQSSKIKPMISAYHYPSSRYHPYSNTAFPWQGERSSTVIAAIPIAQNAGVSVMGNTYLFRHDNEGDHLQEIVPDKTRDVELWLTYPDGSDVLFYTQFPVFSLNIVDNNEAI